MKKNLMIAALILGFPAAHAADPTSEPNNGVWTVEQIKKICWYRADKDEGGRDSYEKCRRHYATAPGRKKQLIDIKDLNEADLILERRAFEKAAEPKAESQ